MTMPSRARPDAAGFSLIEVLIAMLVLSVGAGSLLALFAAGASTHRRAVDRTNAALIAESVMSELRSSYQHGMDAEAVVATVKARLPEEQGSYRYDVLLFHPEGDEWAETELYARVTVRWRTGGSDRAESFHAVLTPVLGAASQGGGASAGLRGR